MSVTLENEFLKVNINRKGAELKSVVGISTSIEYMWNGDPVFWGKTSPVLFPIVGTLKNDNFLYSGKFYSLSRHGFARDATFDIVDQKNDRAIFALNSTPASREKYPFNFEFEIEYGLVDDFLEVTYHVKNDGDDNIYFSVGGHPAFKVPLITDSHYEDYYLEFNQIEDVPRWPINAAGLIKEKPVPFIRNSAIIKLNRSLFDEDAIVFKDLKSNMISLKSDVHSHGLDFYFEGFPFLGLWAAKNADFVCIEPWCGIADSESHDQHLETKEGIIKLVAKGTWSRKWKVRFY